MTPQECASGIVQISSVDEFRARNTASQRRHRAQLTPEQKARKKAVRRATRALRTPDEKRQYALLRKAARTPEWKAKEKVRARAKYIAMPELFRARWLKRYGLTPEAYDVLLEVHGGRCALCSDTRVCVDHDHLTGRIRGLLCRKCNSGLGLLGDDLNRIQAAADYLRRTSR